MCPANSKSYMKSYMRNYMKKSWKRMEKQKRERDLYHYERKNWALKKWQELDHTRWVRKNSVRVISKALNRSLGAKKAIKRRKARKTRWWKY